ncbi:phosphocholine-specific phospholipase C [uncultured Phenylobacterium sp.]|uniref:phosphocholine-specific phospholipase C n=1 Tax=uncultured Phenylobacterium sp. TaxID=349273 RepID=UPI0025CE3C07|nr:phospholipase C, phosphocholine-specific [uncultured Phenylobacterium sp.]
MDRRSFLLAAAATAGLPAAIARARAIDAHVRTGTIQDVEHVVIFMQENRGFDHYFGAMNGVRGFADRFPIPLAGGRTVWTQASGLGPGRPAFIAPFPLETEKAFGHMRVEGTPHYWADAQAAWDEGRMARWPAAKREHSMAFYQPQDLPFHYALADAFTVCDAYHCSIQAQTNPNRLFLFTGTHDPLGKGGGPGLFNTHDQFPEKGGSKTSYTWTTYPERLTAAGVSWRVYQDMADNFGDNPLVGFAAFRAAHEKAPGSDPRLARDGLSTYTLEALKADVLAGTLPQVSHIIAPAAASEHPGPSSPAQGADYTARLLDALTANPEVWSRTALFLMFDENDGFFDHVPPPAPPSRDPRGGWLGGSTVDLTGEYHDVDKPVPGGLDLPQYRGRPYGLGARVPMIAISPWSRGGWVNSEVFDHTSIIRFLEARFGVREPNISPWRRAVCGDLTSAFDFRAPNRQQPRPGLPPTADAAARAAALKKTTKPPTPAQPVAPVQARGVRPSRALPYALDATVSVDAEGAHVTLESAGTAAAVFHVYDLLDLAQAPRRYTLGAGERMADGWSLQGGRYDLWILGPSGFHRHFRGAADPPLLATAAFDPRAASLKLTVRNGGGTALDVAAAGNGYGLKGWRATVPPGQSASRSWPLARHGGWYDLSLTLPGRTGWLRRFAGRLETGRDSISDPEMHGAARMGREP